MRSGAEGPVTVAVVNDYEIVVAGVAAALAPYAERVRVVEIDSGMPVASDVDVVLYDTFGAVQGNALDIDDLLSGQQSRVVVFSWNVQPELVRGALAQGAAGYISKALSAAEIADAIEAVARGEVVTPPSGEQVGDPSGDWPGRDLGITARESEVLALIVQGYSNQEIAERTYLSINSVKTYIRTAYRKIGVQRRSQAVAWGMRHGFAPDRLRSVDTSQAQETDEES